MPRPDPTALQRATIALNQALDDFWNAESPILGMRGMASHHMARITEAQRECRDALLGEGVILDGE